MQAFNEKSNGQTLRKFQWGGAVLTADFVDREENLITVKAIETPHPDLIKAFKAFKQYAESMLGLNCTSAAVQVQTIEFPEEGKIVFSGLIITEFYETKFKTIKRTIKTLSNTINANIETEVETLKTEVFAYIFKNKTAQAELPFEIKGDGLDGARALMSQCGSSLN